MKIKNYWRKKMNEEFYANNMKKIVDSIPKSAFVNGLTRIQIKNIYKIGVEDTLSLLRLKCLCRIRGLSIDIKNQPNKEYYGGAKNEYQELYRHLEELKFIIADIECAKKYLSKEEKKEFEGIISGNPLVKK